MPKGLVKSIGVSNFTITKMEALLKTAKIIPAVNQGGLRTEMKGLNMCIRVSVRVVCVCVCA